MKNINIFRGEYAFLSNFYEVPVNIDGIIYKSSEAAFQAQKCETRNEKLRFAEMTALEAKRHGKRVNLRPTWDKEKVSIMRDVVLAKFTQNPELMQNLLQTGDAYLEEGNTWGDQFWGTVNGKGANFLGHILMETREILKNCFLEGEKP